MLLDSSDDDSDSVCDAAIVALQMDIDEEDLDIPTVRVTGKQPPMRHHEAIAKNVRRSRSEVQAESVGFPVVVFKRAVLLGVPGWFFGTIYMLRRLAAFDTAECFDAV